MANDVAIGPAITAEFDQALARLAAARGKSKSALIHDALTEYVSQEEAFIGAVEEGLAALDAGDAVPHDQARREIQGLSARKR